MKINHKDTRHKEDRKQESGDERAALSCLLYLYLLSSLCLCVFVVNSSSHVY